MLWLTLCVILLSIIVIRVINHMNYWRKRDVTYRKTWPLVGGLKDAVLRTRNVGDIVLESYNLFPGKRYYGSHMFTVPSLFVTDLDLIKKITIKDFDYFVDHIKVVDAEVNPLFGKNLVALEGQKWRNMRNTLSPLFTGNKIRVMFRLISDCAKQLNDHFLKQNQDVVEIEAKDVMSRIAIDMIATIAFGVESNSLKEDNQFYKMGNIFNQSNLFSFFKVMIIMAFPKVAKALGIRQVPKDAGDFFEGLIRETLKQREEKNITRPDMIHILIEARKGKKVQDDLQHLPDTGFAAVEETKVVGDGEAITKEEITIEDIVAQGFLFFLAGFDVVSTLLAHLCNELALNPDVQEKLQAEVDLAFSETKGELNYETLVKMKYLDMVVSETLRKWPLGILLNRLCVRDYKIEASEIHGEPELTVEKDTAIFIPIYGIHCDPKYYPEPEKFDPERFNDENKHKIDPYAYLPFGIGPRNCIGSRLALLEAKVIIVYLLLKFEIVVVEKTQIPVVLSPKVPRLSPDKFWLGLKKRMIYN